MDAIQQHIHQRVLDTWEIFPWKLDYILYLIFSTNNEINDIYLHSIEDDFTISYVSSDGKPIPIPESEKLLINQHELCDYLNIATTSSDDIKFEYTTKIFSNEYQLKGYKFRTPKRDVISFSMFDKIENINFNNFLEKYILSYDLTDNLSTNSSTVEKKAKI